MNFIIGLLLGGLIVGYFLAREAVRSTVLRTALDAANKRVADADRQADHLSDRLWQARRLRHRAELRRRETVQLLEQTRAELEWARVIIAVQMADADLRPVILAEHRKKGAGTAQRLTRRVS